MSDDPKKKRRHLKANAHKNYEVGYGKPPIQDVIGTVPIPCLFVQLIGFSQITRFQGLDAIQQFV